MKKAVIVGAGGFGREVHKLIDEVNNLSPTWQLVGYIDEGLPAGKVINGLSVLGGDSVFDTLPMDVSVILAIGNPTALFRLANKLTHYGREFPNIIHPSVCLDDENNTIGVGNIFTYGFYLTRNISIGSFNVFNTRVTIGHDTKIGSFNVFMPNVQISGNVTIENCNFFGMNSSVLPKKKIGSKNLIGACSLVIRSLRDEQHVFGIPAQKLV